MCEISQYATMQGWNLATEASISWPDTAEDIDKVIAQRIDGDLKVPHSCANVKALLFLQQEGRAMFSVILYSHSFQVMLVKSIFVTRGASAAVSGWPDIVGGARPKQACAGGTCLRITRLECCKAEIHPRCWTGLPAMTKKPACLCQLVMCG